MEMPRLRPSSPPTDAPSAHPQELHEMLKTLATAAVALVLTAGAAFAQTVHEVKMLNKSADGKAMVFEPAFVKAAAGDTIKFVATDAGHNAETIKDAIPAGAEPFKSKPGKDFEVTLTAEGVYLVKCSPHYAMGMVMAVQVGAPTNLDAIKAVKTNKKSEEVLTPILAGVTQ
jgi:pseudoazurin